MLVALLVCFAFVVADSKAVASEEEVLDVEHDEVEEAMKEASDMEEDTDSLLDEDEDAFLEKTVHSKLLKATTVAQSTADQLAAMQLEALQYCDAKLYQRALAKARAGDMGWWDDAQNAIAKVGDALNMVKSFECGKCGFCMDKAGAMGADLFKTVAAKMKGAGLAAFDSLITTVCANTFDPTAAVLCGAVTAPIPIPGTTPVICPPFVIYAHTKCTEIFAGARKFLADNAKKLEELVAGKLAATGIPSFSADSICKTLGLCPKTRTDC